MKATGIIRRVDGLGRIVLPKELRAKMKIRTGDSIEIFTDNGGKIILVKYSLIGNISESAENLCGILAQSLKRDVVFSDNETVIAASSAAHQRFIGRALSVEAEKTVLAKEPFVGSDKNKITITEAADVFVELLMPIIYQGDVVGCAAIIAEDGKKLKDSDVLLVKTMSEVLVSQIEA
jgi:AbrB family transcriptional regulator (stage V sporulation protein T)